MLWPGIPPFDRIASDVITAPQRNAIHLGWVTVIRVGPYRYLPRPPIPPSESPISHLYIPF